MTVDYEALHATNDAMVWAEAFADEMAHKQRGVRAMLVEDPGFMVGWFANAMAAQEAADRKVETDAMVEMAINPPPTGVAAMIRKPSVVKMMRWERGVDFDGLADWVGHQAVRYAGEGDGSVEVYTGETWARVNVGDWVALDVEGKPYPIRHSVVQATYSYVGGRDV